MAQATPECSRRTVSVRIIAILAMIGFAVPGCAPFRSVVETYRPSVKEPTYEEFAQSLKFDQDSGASQEQQASDELTSPPRSIIEAPSGDVWHITLIEAIHHALSQNAIIPVDSQFLATGSILMSNPQAVASVYDPALQQTSVQGARGVDAAESDFIPTLSAQRLFTHDENIQNNLFSGGLMPGEVLDEQNDTMALLWDKQLHSGGRFSVRHDLNRDENNAPSRLFGSAYNTQLSFDLTQPLLQGSGRNFTDIAGPISLISDRNPSLDQGIVVARLNEEQSENEFQLQLQQLVKDVSDVYWDLHFAHRQLEIETRSRDEAMLVWQKALAKRGQGLGGGIAEEAQAHESFLAARARLEESQAQVALTETRFRRLLGLPGNEHQQIVPFEQPTREMPTTAWMDMLINAFSQRRELRATKLSIRNLEAQLEAAQNYAQPRFDFVGNFHLNGFGDKAFSDTSTAMEVPRGSYANLLRGDETGWTLGFVFSRPTDPRLPLTLKHQLELRLAKTRAALAAQEWEITRELSYAVKNAERWYLQTGTHEERVAAARTQVNALEAAFPTGRVSVDQLVRAQATLAQAETEFARSLAEYNKTLAELEYRQGILLERHAISVLGESESEDGDFEE